MKPPYTFEEILLILETARMDDVSQRLRELWAEKEALAAPQGEPCAWVYTPHRELLWTDEVEVKNPLELNEYIPLYKHPAPAPLSDEQINEMWLYYGRTYEGFARAIERHVRGEI